MELFIKMTRKVWFSGQTRRERAYRSGRYFLEERDSVEHLIPECLLQAAVQLIPAGFGDQFNRCSGITAVLSLCRSRDDTELFQSVGRNLLY